MSRLFSLRSPRRVGGAALVIAAIAALTGIAAYSASAQDGPGDADTVFVNGRVLLYPETGTPEQMMSSEIDWAEAVAVKDGLISYVGGDAGAEAHVGPETDVIDLQNKMMMPGLGDGHLHGGTEPMCNLNYEGGTIEDVLGKLKACLLREDQIAHLNSNFRLSASRLMGEGMIPPGTRLDRHVLDRLSEDPEDDPFGTGTTRPIVVGHMDGHKTYTNTQAIVNAGLDENTPDPPDGFIGRDPDGYPNGQFADFFANWGPSLPAPPDATYNGRVANIEFANSLGITSILRPGGGANDLTIAKRLADEGNLTVHLNQAMSASNVRGEDDPAVIGSFIDTLNTRRETHDGYSNPASPGDVAVDTVKIFCDGVPEFPGQTAAMIEPYRVNLGTPENPQWVPGEWRGEEPSCEDGVPGFTALDAARWNIHVHSLGDRSTRVTLNNFETAMDENSSWDRRHTITHLEFIDDRDLDRFGELGVVASMSQQWNQRDGWSVDGIEGYIAPDRMDNMYPTRDLIDGGAVVAQGSDWPVTDLLPWAAIEQAVTREGQVNPARAIYPGQLNAGDAITLEQALKTSTIGVAYQMHQDDLTGSIEVGKYADLIVLDRDPYDPPGGERTELEQARADLARAEGERDQAEDELAAATDDAEAAKVAVQKARAKVRTAKLKLEIAKATGEKERIARAKRRLERAKEGLASAEDALTDARASVADAQQSLDDAEAAVETAADTVAVKEAEYEQAFEAAIKDISETEVLMTMLVGETVYTAPGSPLG